MDMDLFFPPIMAHQLLLIYFNGSVMQSKFNLSGSSAPMRILKSSSSFENTQHCLGFTLIELMLVISIIGILSTIAIPNYLDYRKKSQITEIAVNLKNFEKAFITYAIDQGDFPADTHLVLPDVPIMSKYINPVVWSKTTALGGNYNWEGPDSYPYAGIALFASTASQSDLIQLDHMVDNGDLSQGKFRQTPNGRYTYIISE